MKKKTVPAILIHLDWIETIKCLSHEQIGKFFVAMLDYANTGNEPEFEDNFMRALFTSFKKQIDRDRNSYEEKCKKIDELMMFFFGFKLGRYERFYCRFDTQIFMGSIPLYLKKRNEAIDHAIKKGLV